MASLSSRHRQSGQVALIVVLLMTVVLATGLNLASRSAEELLLSTQQVETTRVFSGAEAGLEEALAGGLDFEGSEQTVDLGTSLIPDTEVSYTVRKRDFLEMHLDEGVAANIDLTGPDLGTAGRVLDINWSRESTCGDLASLVVTVYNDQAGVITVRHYAYEGCARGDDFTASIAGDAPYAFKTQLTLEPDDVLARVRPVYADTWLRVQPNNFTGETLGYLINSRARNVNGDELRSVEVERSVDSQASIFDYVLLSGTGVVK